VPSKRRSAGVAFVQANDRLEGDLDRAVGEHLVPLADLADQLHCRVPPADLRSPLSHHLGRHLLRRRATGEEGELDVGQHEDIAVLQG
jgi:hypothetical protein